MKTKKFGNLAVVGLIVAAMAAPLPALAAQGKGPRGNAQIAQTKQVRPDCPNNGQQLRDGSGKTRKGSLHQNRGAGLKNGKGKGFNRGRAQVAQTKRVRPDCPNNGQQLRDGSGRTRKGSLHQNRGAGLKNGKGRGFNRGPAQS